MYFRSLGFQCKLFLVKLASFLFLCAGELDNHPIISPHSVTRFMITWQNKSTSKEQHLAYCFFKLRVSNIFSYQIYLYHFSLKVLPRFQSVSTTCMHPPPPLGNVVLLGGCRGAHRILQENKIA